MKRFLLLLALSTLSAIAATRSEMLIEEILLNENTGEKTLAITCTCYRGPGTGQPYTCAPVAKTCYGGPGNYPYTCYVCPQ